MQKYIFGRLNEQSVNGAFWMLMAIGWTAVFFTPHLQKSTRISNAPTALAPSVAAVKVPPIMVSSAEKMTKRNMKLAVPLSVEARVNAVNQASKREVMSYSNSGQLQRLVFDGQYLLIYGPPRTRISAKHAGIVMPQFVAITNQLHGKNIIIEHSNKIGARALEVLKNYVGAFRGWPVETRATEGTENQLNVVVEVEK